MKTGRDMETRGGGEEIQFLAVHSFIQAGFLMWISPSLMESIYLIHT